MRAVKLKNNIYWIGAVDWAVRDFHGYETPRGTSYNNYLIVDDEVTVIDTVKYDFAETTIDAIKSVVDPASIKNIVINHIENDHATSLDKLVELSPKALIHITERGKKGLDRFFDTSTWNFRIVKTGDVLKTGKKTLQFVETPMLHWPDSMMTYCKEDKVLFSQDAFGQHLASDCRFDDEFCNQASAADLDDAVVDYYANILMPFGALVREKIAALPDLGVAPEIIAPDHGIIWRSSPQKVVDAYLAMAGSKADLSVSIVYDTMWQSTERMTLPIAEGIRAEGVPFKIIKLRATPMNVVIKEFWKSRGTLIGTPTLNNIMFPSIGEFLTHIRGLRPKDRFVAAFGSYGWAGGGVRDVYEKVKAMGLEALEPGLDIHYRPSSEDEASCYDFGRKYAKKLKKYHAKFE